MTLTPIGARLARELERVLPDGRVCLEPGRKSA